ncbi:hypothetical protein HMPREF2996_00185 [Corynebacterium sp. HMSC066C02]|uniref:hypothetical protein n=1 Tax=Corynebacterium sp. HMSC066C02 TaxID=1739500 RepID=UPI0008A4E3C7|nr:hypothetical protein [Corynebacterium sp. HMSC066C02]OFP19928.1 hypothetical protein HMPREF2996_00185 [Corynebacterium sp. HMSC066C02]
MDYRYIVPTQVPESEHPYAGLFLGIVPEGYESRAARHIFDELGARLEIGEPETITLGWAVDFDTDSDRTRTNIGDIMDMVVPGADRRGVRIVEGHLPPGIRLERHTGKLVGAFTRPGLYDVTLMLGPAVKLDPLGGAGTPGEAVAWIPINQQRAKAESSTPAPKTLADLTALELSQLAAEAMRLERLKAMEELDNGY